jgi:DNA-binding MarR family transcriptional regulator
MDREDDRNIVSDSEVSREATGLRRGTLQLARRLRRERRDDGLSLAKLSVLGTLHRRGELTARQIADSERLQPQSLTRTLAALEGDRLVYRRPDPDDGRRAWLGITGRGLTTLAAEMAERDRWLTGRLERFSPAERAILALAAELMDRVADEAE